MARLHVVWDWNGTLLDDLPIVIEAVNRSIAPFGEGPIDADGYRDHYTRPVKQFYDSLFGRAITEGEWKRLNTSFHDYYFGLADAADLAPDALAAMDRLSDAGWGQSLLSMSPQDWLERIVARFDIDHRFELISGLSGPTGGLKAQHLDGHMRKLKLSGSQVVVVGDTPDDVAAARHVGASAILFHGGSHHLDHLLDHQVPIAETLIEAVELAVGGTT
ncbi:MAG TPA: HAD family hydrolase [Acidimicrobiia bacterium]|nr:HAD family hydrolase [Acidimicrobiia bacterium]